MTDQLYFTVIIPVFNGENFIQKSVESVLSQVENDFELLVVDDGSTDGTAQRLARISDSRLRVIRQENAGVSVARNTGIAQARGEFICFLDADDQYLPHHLSTLRQAIEAHPAQGFFATGYCLRLTDGRVKTPRLSGQTCYRQDMVRHLLNSTHRLWTGCVCIRRSLFDRYGLFQPGLALGEDEDMWRRIYVRTGVVCIDTVTVCRDRRNSRATGRYTRRSQADPLGRLPGFLADEAVPPAVKQSLLLAHEYAKLQVVRTHLLAGQRPQAAAQWRQIRRRQLPLGRRLTTGLCFLLPAFAIRWALALKNRGFYQGK